jgi:hypothetical protein
MVPEELNAYDGLNETPMRPKRLETTRPTQTHRFKAESAVMHVVRDYVNLFGYSCNSRQMALISA